MQDGLILNRWQETGLLFLWREMQREVIRYDPGLGASPAPSGHSSQEMYAAVDGM